MNPVHIVTDKENVAPLVLLPGDPLRAKYIAEKFLTDVKLINTVRNMFAFTGFYKGNRITVAGSGMGCPSVGIYSYELFHFYDVKKIIRIGSSGSMKPDVKIFDVVLSSGAFSNSNFAYHWSGSSTKFIKANEDLSKSIYNTALELNMKIKVGPTVTTDTFDVWHPIDHIINTCPFKNELMCSEMEGFGLFHVAETEGKEAAMLTTIVDSKFQKDVNVTAQEREQNLDQMITLALEAIIK